MRTGLVSSPDRRISIAATRRSSERRCRNPIDHGSGVNAIESWTSPKNRRPSDPNHTPVEVG
jgi:hypothetical protein